MSSNLTADAKSSFCIYIHYQTLDGDWDISRLSRVISTMMVKCFTCGKEFEGTDYNEPEMKEIYRNIRHFCSTKCANEALSEHLPRAKAMDDFKTLTTETAKRIM